MALLKRKSRKSSRFDVVTTRYFAAGMVVGCAVALIAQWVLR